VTSLEAESGDGKEKVNGGENRLSRAGGSGNQHLSIPDALAIEVEVSRNDRLEFSDEQAKLGNIGGVGRLHWYGFRFKRGPSGGNQGG